MVEDDIFCETLDFHFDIYASTFALHFSYIPCTVARECVARTRSVRLLES